MLPEQPELYDVARRTCHDEGFPWTDPRTNVTYPPPRDCPTGCASRILVQHVEHAEIDEADAIAHTAFYLLGCPTCRTVEGFPASNLTLVTPRARRALHLELAADGWWLPL